MKVYFDPQLISKYRTQLMGIAMLWIILFHTPFNDTELPSLLRYIRRTGYGGVDIFFFLSGLGIFFAYKKENLKSFYKKRFLRIIPYYLPIVLAYSLFLYFNNFITLKEVWLKVFLLDYWTNEVMLGWYIPVALLFYLITPFIMRMIGKEKTSHYLLLITLILICGFSIGYLGNYYYRMYDLIRLSGFVEGLLVGFLIMNKRSINIIWIILNLIIGGTLLIIFSLYQYDNTFISIYFRILPFFFLSFSICAILSYLISLFKNYRFPIFYFIGSYTLSIYAFHERLTYMLFFYKIPYPKYTSLILTLILSILWQKSIDFLINHIKRNDNK